MEDNIDNVGCTLKVGDMVRIRDFCWPELGGKEGKVTSVMRYMNCESGFIISTNICEYKMDANWFIKLENNEQV